MSDSDLFDETDSEGVPAIPVSKIVNKHCNFNKQSSSLAEKSRPHIFYTLKEILNFTQEFAPLDNKIRAIGIYEEKGMQLQYLKEDFSFTNGVVLKVLLDLKLAAEIPKIQKQIQVFGFINFKYLESSKTFVPILVVQFWNVIEGNVAEFVKHLQTLQHYYTVSKYKAVNDMDNTYLETSSSLDQYFEEIDDTLLNEAADGAQGVCEGMERLNVSEDLFE